MRLRDYMQKVAKEPVVPKPVVPTTKKPFVAPADPDPIKAPDFNPKDKAAFKAAFIDSKKNKWNYKDVIKHAVGDITPESYLEGAKKKIQEHLGPGQPVEMDPSKLYNIKSGFNVLKSGGFSTASSKAYAKRLEHARVLDNYHNMMKVMQARGQVTTADAYPGALTTQVERVMFGAPKPVAQAPTKPTQQNFMPGVNLSKNNATALPSFDDESVKPFSIYNPGTYLNPVKRKLAVAKDALKIATGIKPTSRAVTHRAVQKQEQVLQKAAPYVDTAKWAGIAAAVGIPLLALTALFRGGSSSQSGISADQLAKLMDVMKKQTQPGAVDPTFQARNFRRPA